MNRKYPPLLFVGKFVLLAQLWIIASVVHVGRAAFVPHVGGNPMICGSSSSSRRSFCDTQRLFYSNAGSSSNNRSDNDVSSKRTTNNNRRRRKPKGPFKKHSPNPNHHNKNAPGKKMSRPTSFAAIRKELRKGNNAEGAAETTAGTTSQNIIDSATIARIGKKRHRQQQREQKARLRAKEERTELKHRAYELSVESERGFQSTPRQAEEMRVIIDRLTQLNPSREPAWSYYGKTNPLTRQLYQSMAGKQQGDDLASLEGKWILTYTDVPSIVSLARDSNRWGLAKLGRIGQECTPFPDYTVRTIIEWKRPDWVQNLESTLPGSVSGWLFGKEQSSVLQKTTLRARATPDDPTSWGVSSIPRVFEVVSSRSSTALYDDDDSTMASTLNFVTDDGLLALDPLKPLKIGLQIAGMNEAEKSLLLEEEEEEHEKGHSKSGTSLVTKDGLVALNPFQPWTVGLQMAGFARAKANEPWKIAKEGNHGDHDHHHQQHHQDHHHQQQHDDHHHNNNLFEDISKRGLVEGVLKQTPIQLPTPDAVASLLGDDDEQPMTPNSHSSGGNAPRQKILYLDEDIRIIGDGYNHVTIESRACTDKDEDCWF